MKIKDKYINQTLSNSHLTFNTASVTSDTVNFYIQKGFAFIFEAKKGDKK